jgi:hypothetical protein
MHFFLYQETHASNTELHYTSVAGMFAAPLLRTDVWTANFACMLPHIRRH